MKLLTIIWRDIRSRRVSDFYAILAAISLPWSTTATAILMGIWLGAFILSLDLAAVRTVRREVLSPAGGLPLLLWGLAVIGMLWADVDWSERFGGLRGYHKLLFIPLLLAQFRRSDRAKWVVLGFFISAFALLVLSWLTPYPGFLGNPKADAGVPVKDYTAQSAIFAICALGLLAQSVEWRAQRPQFALAAAVVAAFFVANIIYVVTARSILVVIAVLLLVFGFRQLGWRGIIAACIFGCVLASLSWVSSPHLRDQVTNTVQEVRNYPVGAATTSTGLRFEFWTKSIEFIAGAPFVGHGTGTTQTLFLRSASGRDGMAGVVTRNPHNQILAVGIELGIIGIFVLIAIWIAHLALFREGTLIAWYGLTIVVNNVVGSLFNSQIFDFTAGWLYVFGVGVLGGAVLAQKQAEIKVAKSDPT